MLLLRIIMNVLFITIFLGQQDPQTGMVTYFLPLLSGSHKVYSTKENSFGVVWAAALKTMLNMEKPSIITMIKAFM